MKNHIIAMIALAAIMVVVIALSHTAKPTAKKETFTNPVGNTDCPTSAERGPDGHIHVNPGNKKFKTLVEYTNYLTGLYAGGSTCIPPKVTNNMEPVFGIRGGLGNGQESSEAIQKQSGSRTVLQTDFQGESNGSVSTPIQKLDDYEYTRVFESERDNRNKIDTEDRNDLLKKRATDWSILPFNSEDRAKQEEEFIAGRMDSAYREPKTGVLFDTMAGTSLQPPDVEAARLREQKILASYRPTAISRHIVDNDTEAVARLVMAQYGDDKNWEPVVEKTGENKWEVTELRPKARKEYYADDTEAAMVDSTKTHLPRPSIDIDDRIQNDPYFDKGAAAAKPSKFWNYNDFRKWTPGLERMFAPTADNKAWY
jgi:hypothetical protein